MATRDTFTSASPGPLAGDTLLDNLAGHVKELYDASAIPLTAVAGTANAVTATLDPALDAGGLADGMKFTLSWAATNTAGMTLAINGGAAVSVLDAEGATLVAGAVAPGLRSMIEYIAGAFRVLTPVLAGAGGVAAPTYIAITASTSWPKPTGLDDDAMIIVEAWGGGGAGSGNIGGTGAGGGGGGYMRGVFRAADVPTSVTVTIGAGGASGGKGGNTSFGTLVTAYGGGGANGTNNGGGGATPYGAGANAVHAGLAPPASGLWDGGGGSAPTNRDGGPAVHGGGGGGSSGTSAGGSSVFGGAGGPNGSPGAAPGGGGAGSSGTSQPGARGEVRIWIP